MADYGASDTSTTTLGANQFPISEVYIPNDALHALGGGPKQTDTGGKVYTSMMVYLQDGWDVAQGTSTDAANANTVIGQLKQIKTNTTSVTIGSLPAISGTVTANIGTTNGVALDATLAKLTIAQSTTLGTTTGPLMQGSVTSGAPTYTTGNINPLSLTTAGALRVDGSGVAQPVSGSVSVSNFPATQTVAGTITANAGSGTFTIQSNASVNLSQISGSTIATAAAGIAKVGLTDGVGNALTSTASALDVNIKSGGGSGFSVVDETAWTAGTSAFVPAGGVFNDTATALTAGQEGTARLTANRGIHANIRNAAGTELATASNPLRTDPTGTTIQPISATALPLPTGAATSAKQPAIGTAGTASSDVLTVQGIASMTALKVDGSAVTQPVSGTVTANAGSGTFTNQQSNVTSDYDSGAGTQLLTMFGLGLPASGGAVPGGTTANPLKIDPTGTTTQPVSGTITANAGTGNFTVVQATGTNLHAVVDSGTITANIGTTAGIALDATLSKLNVAQSAALGSNTGPMMQASVTTSAPTYTTGNINPLSLTTAGALRVDGSGVTQPISGTVTANAGSGTFTIAGTVTANQGGAPWSNNVTQFGGTNLSTGTGASGAGVPRVTVANDSNVLATQSGTWTVQPGNTPNTSAWLVQNVVAASGGSVPYHSLTAASTNFTNVKAAAAQLYSYRLSNTSGAAIFVKFYDKATAPATTDVPKDTVQVPANGTVIAAFPEGMKFTTGFGWGATGAVADNDNTSVAANCVIDFSLNS